MAILDILLINIFGRVRLDIDDYRGEYVIDTTMFVGKQAAWQYDHFRFQITDDDSIFFYVTEEDYVVKVYRGTVRTTSPKNHKSQRLILDMVMPTHHIMAENPTTYRDTWDFYLAFNSSKFYNVYFKKGKWVK